jgi:RimJ/RimL family protein N-acetyltransferase
MIEPGSALAATLRNGLEISIRHVRPDDAPRLLRAFRKLKRATVYTRFFRYVEAPTEAQLDRATHPDPAREVALVVTLPEGGDEIVIAGGRYVAAGGGAGAAEVAFMVEEDYQGLGICGRLLRELAELARAHRLSRFDAEVLAGNGSMLRVFARSGLPMKQRREGGVVHVELALDTQPAPG